MTIPGSARSLAWLSSRIEPVSRSLGNLINPNEASVNDWALLTWHPCGYRRETYGAMRQVHAVTDTSDSEGALPIPKVDLTSTLLSRSLAQFSEQTQACLLITRSGTALHQNVRRHLAEPNRVNLFAAESDQGFDQLH